MVDKPRSAVLLVIVAVGGTLAMGWFWKSKSEGAWDLANVERPWQGDISIYAHVSEHVAPEGLKEGGERLPDEKDDDGPRWVAGGFDGSFGHHGGDGSEKSRIAG